MQQQAQPGLETLRFLGIVSSVSLVHSVLKRSLHNSIADADVRNVCARVPHYIFKEQCPILCAFLVISQEGLVVPYIERRCHLCAK